jgi:hypothetical protein
MVQHTRTRRLFTPEQPLISQDSRARLGVSMSKKAGTDTVEIALYTRYAFEPLTRFAYMFRVVLRLSWVGASNKLYAERATQAEGSFHKLRPF